MGRRGGNRGKCARLVDGEPEQRSRGDQVTGRVIATSPLFHGKVLNPNGAATSDDTAVGAPGDLRDRAYLSYIYADEASPESPGLAGAP